MACVGINGFGRIGRLVLRRSCLKLAASKCVAEEPKVVAVNDPYFTVEYMAHVFKYDSTHGVYPGNVTVIGSSIKVDDSIIEVTNEAKPDKICWSKSGAKYVVDATGLYATKEKAQCLLRDGIQRAVLTYSPKDELPTFVFGVNHECYKNEMKIVSNSSCTTNCLAPLLRVMECKFRICNGLFTTIHAATPSQNVLDGPAKKNFRIGRGTMQNIIPSSTNATKSICMVMPEMGGKLNGIAARVPVVDGSMLDLVLILETPADYDCIKCKLKEAADTYMKGIMAYTDEEIVSSDIIGDARSCIVDAAAGMSLTKNIVKLIAWYDNEWGYACRVVDLLKYMFSRERK